MQLQQLVKDSMRRGAPRDGQLVGIELEYERDRALNREVRAEFTRVKETLTNWTHKPDGSLRDGGCEYVSKPLKPGPQITAALNEMKALLKLSQARAAQRCGFHIHLNAAHMTWGQLFGFNTLYALLEPSLFEKYAPQRREVHFCVPLYQNLVLAEQFGKDVALLRTLNRDVPEDPGPEPEYPDVDMYDDGDEDPEFLVMLAEWQEWNMKYEAYHGQDRRLRLNIFNAPKYTAINYSRLLDLGTVEMRQMPATRDMKLLREWIDLLVRMQTLAIDLGSEPRAAYDLYEEEGIAGLCARVKLAPQEIDEQEMEDAEDMAAIIAGFAAPNHNDIEWRMEA
jgi:hypothetical protein